MPGLKQTLAQLAQARQHIERLARTAAFAPGDKSGGADSALTEVRDFGSNPAGLRMFSYAPRAASRSPAMVVALHGCTQTAAVFDRGCGWSAMADRHGFHLLLPEQPRANNPNTCFTWFSPSSTRRGHGEALSIRQMIDHMIREHGIDPARVFVTGLSAGGAMSCALLAAYPDVFAGGAIIAGLPVSRVSNVQEAFDLMGRGRDASPEMWGDYVRTASAHTGAWPKVSIWHGTDDRVVHPSNAEAIARQWTNVHGLGAAPRVEKIGPHQRSVWHDEDGSAVVELHMLAGLGHGVPIDTRTGIGLPDAHHVDIGISSASRIADFWGLDAHAGIIDIEPEVVGEGSSAPEVSPDLRPRITASAQQRPHPTTPKNGTRDFDPSGVIEAALSKAGLKVPETVASNDPRAIITKTLRSVGLLKK